MDRGDGSPRPFRTGVPSVCIDRDKNLVPRAEYVLRHVLRVRNKYYDLPMPIRDASRTESRRAMYDSGTPEIPLER